MNLDELIEALLELKESGRAIDKEPVYFIYPEGGEQIITSVKEVRHGNFYGQIELS